MPTVAIPHPWIPARPVQPPLGYLVDGDRYIVPGVAEVHAGPNRRRQDARAFARRIAAEPAAYLDVLTALEVPGIVDRRPVSHVRGGREWSQPVTADFPGRSRRVRFQVGAWWYSVRVVTGPLRDEQGRELWALCVADDQELLLSPDLPVERRCAKVRHEYYHAWCLHVPVPTNEEDQAVLFETASEAFDLQLRAQGGRAALERLDPEEARHD